MTVRFTKVARQEFREAVRFYDAQRPGLGREFAVEVQSAVERIKAMPEAWHPLSENARRCRTRRFPYGIIYRARGKQILIVAVAHLHQDPNRWQDRL